MKIIASVLFILGLFYQPVGALSRGGLVWGVDDSGAIYVTTHKKIEKSDMLGEKIWEYVGTLGGQQAVKVVAGPHLNIWAITDDGIPFFRRGVTANDLVGTAWAQAGTIHLRDIAVGQSGVWGVTYQGDLVARTAVTHDNDFGSGWIKILNKKADTVAVSSAGVLWYVCPQGFAYERKSSHWIKRASNIALIAPGPAGTVWALGKDGKVLFSKGFNYLDRTQRAWERISSQEIFESLSVSSDFQVCGVNAKGCVEMRFGATALFPSGAAWSEIPGSFQSVASTVLPSTEPGGQSYTHMYDADELFEDVAFHHVWQLESKGKGTVRFKVRPGSNWQVYASEKLGGTDAGAYKVSSTGKQITLERVDDHTLFSQVDLSFESDNNMWAEYRLVLNNGTVALYQDDKELVSFVDGYSAPVRYLGFGGSKGSHHEFAGIAIDHKADAGDGVALAKGFSQIDGNAHRIAVGSRGNKTLVLAIGSDDKIYCYRPGLHGKASWQRFTDEKNDDTHVAGFKDVSVSSDGVVVALSLKGEPLYFRWKHGCWESIRCKKSKGFERQLFDRIAVGNKYCLWGLKKSTRDLYQWTPHGWKVRDMASMSIDLAADGTVVSVGADRQVHVFNYQDKQWDQLPNPGLLGRIAASSRDNMWGTSSVVDKLYVWHLSKGSNAHNWSLQKTQEKAFAKGFKQISVNTAGTAFALDSHGSIYRTKIQDVDQNQVKKAVQDYIYFFRFRDV